MVRVGRLELPASCSQSKRATNCATPGYEIFQLWSNMGSAPVFDQFPARGKTPSALASQSFPGFWRSVARTPASRSQSRRATNCATPRFLFPGQREVFPKSMPCICLHLKKHAVFPKCSCLYSITDFSEKCQLHLSIQSPTKTCKNAKPPAPSPFSSKKNGEEEKQGHSFSPFTIPF